MPAVVKDMVDTGPESNAAVGLLHNVPFVMEVVALDVAAGFVVHIGVEGHSIGSCPLHLSVVPRDQGHVGGRG